MTAVRDELEANGEAFTPAVCSTCATGPGRPCGRSPIGWRPGMSEEEARADGERGAGCPRAAQGLAQDAGAVRDQHHQELRRPSTPGVVLGDDDIFFVDIGPIHGGCEGDAGDTFVVGRRPGDDARAVADVPDLWHQVRAEWARHGLPDPSSTGSPRSGRRVHGVGAQPRPHRAPPLVVPPQRPLRRDAGRGRLRPLRPPVGARDPDPHPAPARSGPSSRTCSSTTTCSSPGPAAPSSALGRGPERQGGSAMCGVVGLLIKDPALEPALGRAAGAHDRALERPGPRLVGDRRLLGPDRRPVTQRADLPRERCRGGLGGVVRRGGRSGAAVSARPCSRAGRWSEVATSSVGRACGNPRAGHGPRSGWWPPGRSVGGGQGHRASRGHSTEHRVSPGGVAIWLWPTPGWPPSPR